MDLIKRFYSFCFRIKGRLNRKAFLFKHSLLLILIVIIGLLFSILALVFKGYDTILWTIILAVAMFIMMPCLAGMISVQIRRLHDVNFSGWWLLYPFFIGIIEKSLERIEHLKDNIFLLMLLLVLWLPGVYIMYFRKGTHGENKYGADPLGIKHEN